MTYTKDNPLKVEEIWKDVVGYEGYYQVSSFGRVKSLPRRSISRGYITKGKALAISDNGHGYLTVRLKGKHRYVHRLVADAFIPNPYSFNEINHKDENKGNNIVDNLEWCTHTYNATYGTKVERTRATKEKSNSNRRMIEARNRNKSYGAEKPVIGVNGEHHLLFKSLSEAHKQTGVNIGHICMCCKGLRTMAGNYQWRYADEI